MRKRQWLGLVIGSSVVSSGLLALPAAAIPPNQSDITGNNIWNNNAPIFENGGKLDPEIRDRAQNLDRELGEAAERCENAAPPAGPRRIARGPRNPNEVCISPECQQLNGLVQETKDFLEDVNRQISEVRSSSGSQAW